MADIVVDTHILVDIIAQFDPQKSLFRLYHNEVLNPELTQRLNQLIFHDGEIGLIVASSFALMEIVNKFDEIASGKFKTERFYSFINQPPQWFLVEEISKNLAFELIKVSKTTPNGFNVENADALHVSTCYVRGNNTRLATNDETILDLCSYNSLTK